MIYNLPFSQLISPSVSIGCVRYQFSCSLSSTQVFPEFSSRHPIPNIPWRTLFLSFPSCSLLFCHFSPFVHFFYFLHLSGNPADVIDSKKREEVCTLGSSFCLLTSLWGFVLTLPIYSSSYPAQRKKNTWVRLESSFFPFPDNCKPTFPFCLPFTPCKSHGTSIYSLLSLLHPSLQGEKSIHVSPLASLHSQ